MRHLALIFFLILVTAHVVKAQFGKIQTDTSAAHGYLFLSSLYDNNRQVSFASNKKATPVVYYPNDLSGYTISTGAGAVYVSRKVQENQSFVNYFLLREGDGDVALYTLKTKKGKRFFVGDSTRFEELTRANFHTVLKNFQGACTNESVTKRVRFNQNSLARYTNLTNRCYKGYFPTLQIGFGVGPSKTQFAINGFYGEVVPMNHESGFALSFIFDMPLSKRKTGFSVNTQVSFKKETFTSVPDADSEYKVTTTITTLPVSLKYKIHSSIVRPYITAGPALQLYTNSNKIMVGNDAELEPLKTFNVAGQLGLGLEFSLGHAMSLGIEWQHVAARNEQLENKTSQLLVYLLF